MLLHENGTGLGYVRGNLEAYHALNGCPGWTNSAVTIFPILSFPLF